MSRRITRLVVCASLLAATFVITGCATPPTSQAMTTASPVKVAKQHPYTVNVVTNGGAGAVNHGICVDDTEFKAALSSSIIESKLFREVVELNNAQYLLTTKVITLDKPMWGSSFTVTLETGWTLTRTSDKQVVFQQVIKSQHTATGSDAFIGATRMRLAMEGAARRNIEQGIVAIGNAPIATAVASAK